MILSDTSIRRPVFAIVLNLLLVTFGIVAFTKLQVREFPDIDPPIVTTGGEDFHFYAAKLPHIKSTMLGLGCDLKPGLHHPYMTFDRSAILTGIEILTEAVYETLQQHSS